MILAFAAAIFGSFGLGLFCAVLCLGAKESDPVEEYQRAQMCWRHLQEQR